MRLPTATMEGLVSLTDLSSYGFSLLRDQFKKVTFHGVVSETQFYHYLCDGLDDQVSSKIVHVARGSDITERSSEIFQHFEKVGSPVMIGGDEDSSSKTLIAIAHISDIEDIQFLIADPHYCGAEDHKCIVDGGHVKWFSRKDFSTKSFYNFCLPQLF